MKESPIGRNRVQRHGSNYHLRAAEVGICRGPGSGDIPWSLTVDVGACVEDELHRQSSSWISSNSLTAAPSSDASSGLIQPAIFLNRCSRFSAIPSFSSTA